MSAMTERLFALLLTTALLLQGCGNYSNEDIEFLAALPDREVVRVLVPQQAGALQSGQASLHTQTVVTAEQLNARLFALLDVLDAVRKLPPASRTENGRVWGPYKDADARFENRLVVEREAAGFGFQLLQREAAHPEREAALVSGHLEGDTARTGHGSLAFDTASLLSIGRTPEDPNLLSVRVVWAHDAQPRTVETQLEARDAAGHAQTLRYLHQFGASGGRLEFRFTSDTGRERAQVDLVSRWEPSGAGQAEGVVVFSGLDGAGRSSILQCWDARFTERYYDARMENPATGTFEGGAPGFGCDAASGHDRCPAGEATACPFGVSGP